MKPQFVSGPLVLAACLCVAWGQPAEPQRTIRRTEVHVVKSDRVGEYEAAIKQYHEVMGKLPGALRRGVFQSLTGDREYLHVRDYAKFAELDINNSDPIRQNAELARIALRMFACIEKRTVVIEEMQSQLSLPRQNTPPKMLVLSKIRVRPDKIEEFRAVVQNELKPAHQKAGQTFVARQTLFGAPRSEFSTWVRWNSWADRDVPNPIQTAMGDAAYAKMAAKIGPMIESRTINVLRFRSDLSYSPPTAATSNTSSAAR
jgi:quinol monooxygenase YgiN